MRITGRTKLAGIMGWPVSHSRSPALHNFWLDEHGIDGAYVPLPVQPEQLERALRALPALGFRGCNLTLPHKEAALAIVDRVDPLARRIGAVNTVIVMPDGSLEAHNTDAFGFPRKSARGRAGLAPEGRGGGRARGRRLRPRGDRCADRDAGSRDPARQPHRRAGRGAGARSGRARGAHPAHGWERARRRSTAPVCLSIRRASA